MRFLSTTFPNAPARPRPILFDQSLNLTIQYGRRIGKMVYCRSLSFIGLRLYTRRSLSCSEC